MKATVWRTAAPLLCITLLLSACDQREDLEEQVRKLSSIGYAYGPSFSPDGRLIAYISSGEGLPQAWVANVDGSGGKAVSTFDDPVTAVEWSPAGDTLALQVAPGGGLNTQVFLLPATGGEPVRITEGGDSNNWLGDWSEDGRYLTYSSNAADAGSMDCYVFDAESESSRLIATNDGIGRCRLSPDNRHALAWRMKSRGDTNQYLVNLETGEETLLTPHEGLALSNQARFMDERNLLVATNVGRDRMGLARVSIGADGAPGPLVFVSTREDAELEDFVVLRAYGTAVLLWNAAGRSELTLLNYVTGQQVYVPRPPAELAGGLTASPADRRLAMAVSGSTMPTDLWTLDLASGQYQRVTQSDHAGVDVERLSRARLKTYTADDGLELSGWLYPAPEQDPEDPPGPLVIDFHGGPEGQARPSFRPVYQALLSRGISVFAPNVRGSSGFGKAFVNADNGRLRFDAVRDIVATTDFLVNAGFADPERIGIMGGSYGGYMTMIGLAIYPDRFAAGVNLFGVVNFETFFANTEPWMAAISTIEYGDPVEDRELLAQLSPINYLDDVQAPTLVLHGANDTNVPLVEAEQVVERLEAEGVPVKFVLFPDEGHGWRRKENRITSDVEIVRWFERFLVDGATAAAP